MSTPTKQRPWRKLYRTAAWQAARRQQLRDEPLCRMCQKRGRTTAATVVDHVVPHRGNEALFFGGALQSLCKACHDGAKQTEERRGYSREVGVDGFPLDPRHPGSR